MRASRDTCAINWHAHVAAGRCAPDVSGAEAGRRGLADAGPLRLVGGGEEAVRARAVGGLQAVAVRQTVLTSNSCTRPQAGSPASCGVSSGDKVAGLKAGKPAGSITHQVEELVPDALAWDGPGAAAQHL